MSEYNSKGSPDHREKPKKRHRNDRVDDKGSAKRHRHNEPRDSQNRGKHRGRGEHGDGTGSKLTIMDDGGDEVEWVEKDIPGGTKVLAKDTPTDESLSLTSHARKSITAELPPSLPTTSLKRDEWMLLGEPSSLPLSGDTARVSGRLPGNESLTEDYGEATTDLRAMTGAVDFFSSLGTEHKKKKQSNRLDPDKPMISSKELNVQLKEGRSLDQYDTPVRPKVAPGSAGYQWRMKKLQRTYETAEEEGRRVEEVALERFDSLEHFEEAKEEKRILDEREERRTTKGRPSGGDQRRPRREDMNTSTGETRYIFADLSGSESRPSSRASFRRPGAGTDSPPSTPGARLSTPNTPAPSAVTPNLRVDLLRRQSSLSLSGATSPIPRVLTPTPVISSSKRALSPSSLNKLQAGVLKAKLMNAPNATQLEKEFEIERERAASVGSGGVVSSEGSRIEMVPTLDGHGRLYDVGTGKPDEMPLPGNRRKKERIETRDPKTGALIRYNADDDSTTLGEMLRQERFGAGMSDQKDMDSELARAIMTDGKFENDLEYMDDNADRLGRKKMRTDAMKRQFAINDYARTRKVLATCAFCYGEDDSPPKAPVIAMGTKAYLSCTLHEELVDGHCLIVPIQHHLTMLEADDDVWDEVKNFMKCLIQMAADNGSGYFFYETVINLKWQKHTVIECVPVPMEHFDDLPAYFRESILASEAEWSQHKKLINFSERPGGFRRAMVPNLPYFMVQWDYKGERGYGHVIEGVGDAAGGGDPDGAVDEGEKGGGEFPRYFAAEIIGNVLDLEPRRWRRPRRATNRGRAATFRTRYGKYDWTGLIERS